MAKKIPALDKIDLYSINETISRINSALEELDVDRTTTVTNQTDEIIWNERVEVGTTEITKSGLNIDKGTYRFHFECMAGATTDYFMYFNRDKTGANYRALSIYTANGAAVQASGTDTANFAQCEASGKTSCEGTLTIDKLNNQTVLKFSYTRQPTDLFVTGSLHWEDFEAHEYINHITITASVEGGMGKGSHIILWRIADT